MNVPHPLVDQSLLTCHLFPSSFSFMIWYDVNWCTVPSSNQANGRSFIVDPFKTFISFVDFTARHDEWRVNMVIFYSQLLNHQRLRLHRRFLPDFLPSEPSAGRALWWGARCPGGVDPWIGGRGSGLLVVVDLGGSTWTCLNNAYPLVNVHVTMERSTILNGKTPYKWQLSIAMLNYHRVLD